MCKLGLPKGFLRIGQRSQCCIKFEVIFGRICKFQRKLREDQKKVFSEVGSYFRPDLVQFSAEMRSSPRYEVIFGQRSRFQTYSRSQGHSRGQKFVMWAACVPRNALWTALV